MPESLFLITPALYWLRQMSRRVEANIAIRQNFAPETRETLSQLCDPDPDNPVTTLLFSPHSRLVAVVISFLANHRSR